jgi:hypothetical protein
MQMMKWKNFLAVAMLAVVFTAGIALGQSTVNKPSSVIHVITFQWADGVTPEQQKAVFAATEEMCSKIPGIKNVWMKALKVQGPNPNFKSAIVMEFESQEAFDNYAGHPAHKEWYKVYLPARGQSRTHDITN